MKKCNICEETFENHSLYANHIRWKHKDNAESKKKISSALKSHYDKKLGKIIIKHKICENCQNEFTISEREKKQRKKYFCSKKCARSYSTKAKRKEINKAVSKKLKDVGPWNKGKKSIQYYCKECGIATKNKHFCSQSCCLAQRKKKNNDMLSEKQRYKGACKFNFSLNSFPDEFDFGLVEKYGWYKAKNRGNNLNGISRDHMYSIDEGFKNNVPTHIISHPANCKLLPHNINLAKNKKSSISLDELIKRIAIWDAKYKKINLGS